MITRKPEDCTTLAEVRAEIDALDVQILTLLGQRLAYVDRVPPLKLAEGVSAAAPGRRAEVLAKVRALALEHGFDPEIAEPMWDLMIDALIAREERVMGHEGEDG